MITYVVFNHYRAVLYAGDNSTVAENLLRPSPLNPRDVLGEYAEAWQDGKTVAAWDRRDGRGWLSPDGKGTVVDIQQFY